MSDNDNLTNRELHEALIRLYNKNAGLIADVKDAVSKLKETESKLDAAKTLYEKHWSCVIKENYGKTCIFGVVIIGIITCGIVNVLTKANAKASKGDTKIEINNNQP